MKLAPVQSFAQLKAKCQRDSRYKDAVIKYATNNGFKDETGLGISYENSIDFILDLMDTRGNSEEDVIEEINALLMD